MEITIQTDEPLQHPRADVLQRHSAAVTPATSDDANIYQDSLQASSDSEYSANEFSRSKLSSTELREVQAATKSRNPMKLPASATTLQIARLHVQLDDSRYAETHQSFGYTALVSYGTSNAPEVSNMAGQVDLAYQASKAAEHVFFAHKSAFKQIESWRQHGILILASIPKRILLPLLDGSFSRRIMSPSATQPDLKMFWAVNDDRDQMSSWARRANQKGDFVPALYVRELVDDRGQSPTVKQLRKMVLHLRGYLSGDPRLHQQNADIDNQSRLNRSDKKSIASGLHYHLQGSPTRVQNAHTFADALERRLEALAPVGSAGEDIPLPTPLRYFGYSANEIDRQKAHESGKTFLSALALDILKYEYQDSNGVPEFRFETRVFAFLTNREECSIGEELFTRVGGGYFYTGRGFNIADAGVSCASGNLGQKSKEAADTLWGYCISFREDIHFLRRLDVELDISVPKYKADNERRKEAAAQIEQDREAKHKQKERIQALEDRVAALKATAGPSKDKVSSHRCRIYFDPDLPSQLRASLKELEQEMHSRQKEHQQAVKEHQQAVKDHEDFMQQARSFLQEGRKFLHDTED
ncbi:hypothetical protein SLS60_001129 [Paraconiothyrium brasiliense]|uniref:Uncharacterized protein n=1 Tax=Paraconiothyrium brasiliense TaxID=300254 RepID=A0ABR3S9A1_9PLEO